jgi:4a-hydroxytetrahydrobiopterin dehydratase
VSNTASPTPNGWDVVDGALHRRLTFADFAAAFAFMTRVAEIAEEQDHHPDWSNSWNVVEISLRSHDVGGVVTERDVRLAQRINEVLS